MTSLISSMESAGPFRFDFKTPKQSEILPPGRTASIAIRPLGSFSIESCPPGCTLHQIMGQSVLSVGADRVGTHSKSRFARLEPYHGTNSRGGEIAQLTPAPG